MKIIIVAGFLFFGLLITAFFLRPIQFFYYVFWLTGPSSLTPDSMPRLHEAVRLSLFTGAVFFVVVTALIFLRHKNLLGPTSLIAALVLVSLVDLWSFSNPLVRTTNLDVSPKKLGLLESLRADQEICRIVTTGNLFGPNDGLLYGYQDIQGYDPLILKRYLEYINKSQNVPISSEAVNVQYVTRLDNHLIRMLNVKHCVLENKGVLKLDRYLPRAFIVHKALTLPPEKVLDFMMTHDFNPEEVVVFEESRQGGKLSSHDTAPIGNELNHKGENDILDSSFERCHILDYKMNEVKLAVRMNDAGYLVLSELNYPGWKAYVNGKKTRILTGNYIFRVLTLSKGDHNISIKFEPDSFTIGLIISVGSILFFLLFQFSVLIRKKR